MLCIGVARGCSGYTQAEQESIFRTVFAGRVRKKYSPEKMLASPMMLCVDNALKYVVFGRKSAHFLR